MLLQLRVVGRYLGPKRLVERGYSIEKACTNRAQRKIRSVRGNTNNDFNRNLCRSYNWLYDPIEPKSLRTVYDTRKACVCPLSGCTIELQVALAQVRRVRLT